MLELAPRVTDLGGLQVRRLLPQRPRRLVGPWCFVDVFGPARFDSGKPMDVAPHPHIGLQTVTWLLAGEALHNDSLDHEALARPGTLNLMTAGAGIAHAEETPTRNSGQLHGVQLWVALPDHARNVAPTFDHYAERPRADARGVRATVLVGELLGARAAARTFSPIVGAELTVEEGEAVVPLDPGFEHALVPLTGEGPLRVDHLYFMEAGHAEVSLRGPGRMLLIGGAPFGEEILMWWNFVARTTEEMVAAREDWAAGRRFGEVRRYAGPRLPAPPFLARPVPANPIS